MRYPGYTEAEAFLGITIRGNRVRNVGAVGIGVASCGACVIENNVVIHQNPFNTRAIAAPDRTRGANDHAMACSPPVGTFGIADSSRG